MHYAVTFHTSGAQALRLLLDANEHMSGLVALMKRSPIPRTAFWIVRRDANHT
jgi:hypothetical protein